MDYSHKKLIVIVGPTGVGKTDAAIQLALHFNTEIISADSRQLFKEMNVGTAKPDAHQLNIVKHHFIDSHSIHDRYNAAQFGEEALALINKLLESHNEVIVCGGSGLYVKALLEGFDDIPEIPEEVRKGIIENYKENGLSWLQQQVKTLDPEYFERIDNQNPMRLMRALEVRTATGKSISFFQQKAMRVLPFTVVKIGLELSRYELYERIDKRMDAMISKGLFEEAESLYPFRSVTALQTVGYQEVFDFMEGKYNKEEAVRLLKQNSRRYAKRQFTWFKRDAEMVWFHPNAINQMIEMVNTKG